MTYRIPSRLAHVLHTSDPSADQGFGLQVYLRPLPGGPTLVLTDVGALIWLEAVNGASDVAASVAYAVGEPLEAVRSQVESHVTLLVAEGLLEPFGRPGSSVRSHP